MAGGSPALMEFGWSTGGTPAMMEFTISGGGWNSTQGLRREFRKVDPLTGTPEADIFKLQSPGFGTLYNSGLIDMRDWGLSSQPGVQSLDDNFIVMGRDFYNDVIAFGIPIIVDPPSDSEVDILVYQEQERATYLVGFQAPTARSYTYIEDFNPLEDEIQILGLGGRGHVKIMSDENDIPMLTDDIQPAFGM